MTIQGGSNPACAACRYQRRKCTSNCPLAPYFPAHKDSQFRSVHRLFGVSNVTRLLKALQNKDERDDAMAAMIYEAEMRRKFPVRGCSEAINQISLQLQRKLEEYHHVLRLLALHRPPTQSRFEGGDSALSDDFLMNFNGSASSVDYNYGIRPLSFPDPTMWSSGNVPFVELQQRQGLGSQEQHGNNREIIPQDNQGVPTDDDGQFFRDNQ